MAAVTDAERADIVQSVLDTLTADHRIVDFFAHFKSEIPDSIVQRAFLRDCIRWDLARRQSFRSKMEEQKNIESSYPWIRNQVYKDVDALTYVLVCVSKDIKRLMTMTKTYE